MLEKEATSEKEMPEPTIGEQLFPGAYEQPKEETPEPTKPAENAKEEGAEIPVPAPTVEAPPLTDNYLDTELLKGKKAKLKVDGQEIEVPAEELIRNYQTWQHLSRVGQKIGEQKRELNEEIARLEQLQQPPQQTQVDESWGEVVNPFIKPVNSKIVELEATVKNLNEALRPTLIKSNVDRTDELMKSRGLTDFKDYYPKIQNFLLENVAPEKLHEFDNQDTFIALYQEMKLQDIVNVQAKTPVIPQPVVSAKPKPIPKVESSNASTNTEITSAIDKKLEAATEKAKASNSSWDWAEVFRLRDEKSATT